MYSSYKRFHLIAQTSLFTAVLGTAVFYADFAKLGKGSLFLLEILFVLWAVPASMAWACKPSWPARQFRLLRQTALFFGWGLLVAAYDLLFRGFEIRSSQELVRFFQHGILFVYPMFWVSAGVWLASLHPLTARNLVILVFIGSTVGNVLSQRICNYTIGPLIAVVFVGLLIRSNKTAWASFKSKPKAGNLALTALAVATFSPYASMLHEGTLQRTQIIQLALTLIASALLFGSPYIKKAFSKPLVTLVAIFAGMTLTVSALKWDPIQNHLTRSWFHEVVQIDSASDIFRQSPSRMYWWKIAIKDWKQNPIFGVGFIPEVPSMLYELPLVKKNTWDASSPGSKPISGPHNSYLSILARMGLIGLALWIWLVMDWVKRIRPLLRSDWIDLLLIFVPLNGIVYATLNVGLESPHNCLLLWFFAGMALARAETKPQQT